jgi:hypothetical protein
MVYLTDTVSNNFLHVVQIVSQNAAKPLTKSNAYANVKTSF